MTVCEHLEALGYTYLVETSHAVVDDTLRDPRATDSCGFEVAWATPAAEVHADAVRFVNSQRHAVLVQRCLTGDRDALVELITAHADTFRVRPLV